MPKHIYDADFKYTPSGKTDLAKKFKQLERELKAKQKTEPKVEQGNVRALKRRAG